MEPRTFRSGETQAAIAVMRMEATREILGGVKAHPDRLRDVIDAVFEAIDARLDGRALAVRAMLSPPRTQAGAKASRLRKYKVYSNIDKIK